MATSLRLAANNLRMGLFIFMTEPARSLRETVRSFTQARLEHLFRFDGQAILVQTATERNALALQQRLRIAYGHTKIGATKSPDRGKSHADHLAIPVNQRPTRPTRSGLGIVDNFVRQNVANMSLRHQRPDQLALFQFIHDFLRVAAACLHDIPDGLLSRARQDGAYSGCVSQGNQELSAYRRLLPSIDLQAWTVQRGNVAVKNR